LRTIELFQLFGSSLFSGNQILWSDRVRIDQLLRKAMAQKNSAR
jgi:hypothetical protein